MLSNDTDADEDTLSAVLLSGPSHGTLTLESDGSFSYAPNADYNGTDSFTYKANDGTEDSNVATVTIAVARDLGGIRVVELPHLNPARGDLWYKFRTTRDALITLWPQGSEDVTITLYDENVNELARTPGGGNQRVEWPAEEGHDFYFSLSGTDDDVNVHLANVIKLNDRHATVFGTDGNNEFAFDAETYQITINGIAHAFDPSTITSISFDGGAGSDTAEIRGSTGNETFAAKLASAVFTGSNYRITVANVANVAAITALGGGGTDVAKLYDSAGDDFFVATPHYGALYGEGFCNKARDFDAVHSYATDGGLDVARMYDSAGDDRLYASPVESSLYANGFYNRAKYFEEVYANATGGGADQAFLHDSAGDDLPEAAEDWCK